MTNEPTRSADLQTHATFNYAGSDVSLRSSDGVLFRVHKTKLAAHSTVFEDMFECGTAGADERTTGIPVSESAATLEVLLSLCYPIANDDALGKFDALPLDTLIEVYEATHKYGMWVARELIAHRVAPLVSSDPFRLVRTGYVLRNQALLTAAARATLESDILGDVRYRAKAGQTWTSLVEYHLAYKRLVTGTLHSMSCMLVDSRNPRPEDYRCGKLDYAIYCANAKLYQGRWHDLRDGLYIRLSAGWPEAALRAFIDASLNDGKILSCDGCANTWREMRKRAENLRPSLILTLDEIDSAVSA